MKEAGPSVDHGTDEPRLDGTLAGLRPEDLSHGERRALLRVISSDEGNKARAQTLALARAIAKLEAPPSELHPADVLERLRRREQQRMGQRWARAALAGFSLFVALVAALLLWPAPSWTPGTVQLEAHATHSGVRRALGSGSQLPVGAELELTTAGSGSGSIFLVERWGYDATRVLIDGEPASNGPRKLTVEERSPEHRAIFEAWLCPPKARTFSPETCTSSRLRIDWR